MERCGADNAIRTRDLILTKDVLCRLSYISKWLINEVFLVCTISELLNCCQKPNNRCHPWGRCTLPYQGCALPTELYQHTGRGRRT